MKPDVHPTESEYGHPGGEVKVGVTDDIFRFGAFQACIITHLNSRHTRLLLNFCTTRYTRGYGQMMVHGMNYPRKRYCS